MSILSYLAINPNALDRNIKSFVQEFPIYASLLTSVISDSYNIYHTEGPQNHFSSFYFLVAPQPVGPDLKLSDSWSFEVRFSPSFKYNFYGKLSPSKTGNPDD